MSSPTEPCRALVVDDAPMDRMLIGILLRDMGFSVSEADCVRCGLNAFQAEQPAVLIVDLTLPDGSGREIIAAVRSLHSSRPRIVVVSGSEAPEVITEAMKAGADSFIPKPVSLQALREALSP